MSSNAGDGGTPVAGSERVTLTPGERAEDLVRRFGILVPFAVLFVLLVFASPTFLTERNLFNILDQQSAIIIIASAGTLVLIAGGIDLSVGSTYALAAVTAATVVSADGGDGGGPVWLAIVAGITVGLVVGIANGVIVTKFRIHAFIATFATFFIVGGLAAFVTQGNLVIAFERLDFRDIATTRILGLTSAAWVMIVFATVIGVLLAFTAFGRYVYATGGNAEAARLGGVATDRIRFTTFAISGLAAGLAGTLDTARVLTAQAQIGGVTLVFTVLAGIVVGGTSIFGGVGAVWRTVVGCLFIALIGNGFNLLGLDPFYRQITLGSVILIAAGIDAWSRRSGT